MNERFIRSYVEMLRREHEELTVIIGYKTADLARLNARKAEVESQIRIYDKGTNN